METIMQLVALAKAHAWETLGLYLLLGLLTAAISRRSQIDAWAEAQPRLAGVLKLMRAVNLDYWMILQGLSLLIRGRLPNPPKDPKDPPSAGGSVPKGSDVLRGLTTLGLCLFAFGCASAEPLLPKSALDVHAKAVAVCLIAQSYDGTIPKAEALLKYCDKVEYLEPWAELADEARAIVEAQRKGMPRPVKPEPVEPTPAPAPPPKPPTEPAIVPKPATEA
jgi:hypothetical protein